MFEVIEKETGKRFMVYATSGEQFLVSDGANGFVYRHMGLYSPISALDPKGSNAAEIKNSLCIFTTAPKKASGMGKLLADIVSGAITVNLGDTISTRLLDGREVDFVVTTFDGNSIRFETRDCLGDYVPVTDIERYFAEMWKLLPVVLRDNIIPTKRRHFDKDGKEYTVTRKLFLPAAAEIFTDAEVLGDKGLYEQMEWYKNVHNRIRAFKKGGRSEWYWTDTPYSGNTTNWCYVSSYGYAHCTSASNTSVAVPVCFRICRFSNPRP